MDSIMRTRVAIASEVPMGLRMLNGSLSRRAAELRRGLWRLLAFVGHLVAQLLLQGHVNALAAYPQPQAAKQAHVVISHPDQRKAADKIAAPVVIPQAKPCNEKDHQGDPVAETILTGNEIEQLPHRDAPRRPAALGKIFARLFEDVLMRHRPRDARDRQGKDALHEQVVWQRRHATLADSSS